MVPRFAIPEKHNSITKGILLLLLVIVFFVTNGYGQCVGTATNASTQNWSITSFAGCGNESPTATGVTYNGSISIAGLGTDETLNFDINKKINGPLTFSANGGGTGDEAVLVVKAGTTLEIVGSLTVGDYFKIIVESGATLTANGTLTAGQGFILENYGTVNISGSDLGKNSTLNIYSSGALNFINNSDLKAKDNFTLNLSGSMKVNNINLENSNDITLNINQGSTLTVQYDLKAKNNAVLNINSSVKFNNVSLGSNADINVYSSATLATTYVFSAGNNSTIEGNGTMQGQTLSIAANSSCNGACPNIDYEYCNGSFCPTRCGINPGTVSDSYNGSSIRCSGNNSGTLTLSGLANAAIVNWEYSVSPFTQWVSIANTSSSQTYSNLTETRKYRVVVKKTDGTCSGTSSPATITISGATPTATGGSVCGSGTVTLSASGATPGDSYKWYTSSSGGTSFATATSISVSVSGTTDYWVSSYSSTCESARTKVTATVYPKPVLSVPSDYSVCSGAVITPGLTSSVSGSTFGWTSSNSTVSIAVNGNNWIITNATSATATTIISVTATTPNGCTDSKSFKITVDPLTVAGSVNSASNSTLCYNAQGALTLNGHLGAVQKWQYSTNGSTWTDIAYTGTSYTSGNLTQTTQFRAVVQSGSCSIGYSGIATVNVKAYIEWEGATSTDWNTASNWCGGIPTASDDVVIPSTSTFKPVITSPASCRNLSLASGSSITIGNIFTITGTTDMSGTIAFTSGANVTFTGNATINGTWKETAETLINFKGNANFTNARYLNDGTGALANGIQSQSTVNIEGMLTLPSNGKIKMLNDKVLTLGKNASYSNASQTNFIEGKLAKITASTEPFIFPVGLDTLYRRIGIIPQNNSETTFTATYLKQSADAIGNASTDKSALNGDLSTIEYWDIHRDAPSTTGAKVIMFWGKSSDIAPNGDFDVLEVAHYNTSLNSWEVFPVTLGDSYSVNSGYMTTQGYLSNFSPLSAKKARNTLLPVVLKTFTVSLVNKAASLMWETTFESNNAGFDVERSYNGFQTYEKIGFVEGNGTLAGGEYSFLDASPAGPLVYYRLKQVDYNGKYQYSDIRYLQISRPVTESILYPNPTTGIVVVTLEGIESENSVYYSIIGADGQVRVAKRQGSGSDVNNLLSSDISNLNNGAYTLIIVTSKNRYTIKLIKI
jgi:hypothetical protein